MNYGIAKFLIVDDDAISVLALERTIKKLRLANPVVTAKDGAEALDVLNGTAGRSAISPPFIMLLDMNMPRMNGIELLDRMRADPALQKTIVFMLTSSDAPNDVDAAYRRNVAGYLLKGASPEDFRQAMELIDTYAQAVVLPQ